MRHWGISLLLAAVAVSGAPAPKFSLADSAGVTHTDAEWRAAKAAVLFFIAADCPISNGYVPEMNRIAKEYASRGVRVYGVMADTSVPLPISGSMPRISAYVPGVDRPEADPGEVHECDTVTRRRGDFAGRPLCTIGPHRQSGGGFRFAAPSGHPARFAGRSGCGSGRESPWRSRSGKAIGCSIVFRELRMVGKYSFRGRLAIWPTWFAIASAVASGAAPTFNADIAPILYQNCATCHRPGEVAPFSLLTYQDAVKRAKQIATVTESRFMPPWKAQPGMDLSRMSGVLPTSRSRRSALGPPAARLKAILRRSRRRPRSPEGWQAGQPDKVFTLPEKFSLACRRAGSVSLLRHPHASGSGRVSESVRVPPRKPPRGASRHRVHRSHGSGA